MNKTKIVFIVIILIFFLPVILSARNVSDITTDTFEETSGRGLRISSNPSGVKVFINGVERGLTPVAFEALSPGEHQITLTKEGYRERRFNVTLFSGSRLDVSIKMEELRGLALVSVYKEEDSPELLPFDPQISASALDESGYSVSLSHDNKTLLNLPVGYHTIRARAFGWEDTAVTVYVNEYTTVAADIFMKSAAFRIENSSQSRKRFNAANPNNLGSTDYRFEVSAPGTGTISILNKNGGIVYTRQLNQFSTRFQNVTWNGRDADGNPLPDGIYTVLIEAAPIMEFTKGEAQTLQIKMETEIDNSIDIYPLSLMSGISGLIFAPTPAVLPAKSYQIEAGVHLGKFSLPADNIDEDGTFTGIPFVIGIRIAPVKHLEAAAVFNVNPRLNNAGWGITGSLKYNFFRGNLFPLSLAAAASYAWTNENGEFPLSPGRGIGLYTPASLELRMFSIIFTPGIFWHGPEGIAPNIMLSAGILYRNNWMNAGLSMRSEFNYKENSSPRFLAGAEGRFYPAPSNLSFLLHAGLWTQNSRTGGYGGIGISIIF